MSRRALARSIAVPRLRSQPGVLVAVVISVLVATTLLATGPVLSTALSEAGLRARLEQSRPRDIGVTVEVRTSASRADAAAAAAVGAVRGSLGDLVTVPDVFVLTGTVGVADGSDRIVVPAGRTITPDVPADDGRGAPAALLERSATDAGTTDEVAVLVHERALEELGAEPGDRIRLDTGAVVVVAGVLAASDQADPRWWDDTLWRDGLELGETFTTVGPLVPVTGTLGEVVGEPDPRVVVTVRSLPEADAIRPSTLADIGPRARALPGRVDRALAGVLDPVVDIWTVDTPIVRAAQASALQLGSTRAAVLATVAQVAVLALYTLGLSGRLLRSGREIETLLVRARGATPRQLGWAALTEGGVVVLPALALAPFAATLVTRVLGRLDVVAGAGLTLVPRPSLASLGAGAVAAAACLLLLVRPAVTSARRTYASTRGAQGRRRVVTVVQSSGLDLALVTIAGIGVWQLRAAGAPVSQAIAGDAGQVDLVLVAAPALGLLAGALLVLRLVPLMARAGERLVTGRRGLVASLSGWQVSRRPDTIARPTLLLVLGVAIGVLATTYATTWSVSQDEQAVAAVGADGVAVADVSAGAMPTTDVAAAIAELEGIEGVSPTTVARIRLPGDSASGTVVAIGVEDPLVLTPAEGGPTVPLGALDVDRLAGPAVPVGDTLTVDATSVPDPNWPSQTARVALVVRDGDGLVHLLPQRTLEQSTSTTALEWDVADLRRPAVLLGIEVTGSAAPADGAGSAVAPDGTDDRAILGQLAAPVVDIRLAAPRVDGRPVDLAAARWTVDPLEQSGPSLRAPSSLVRQVDGNVARFQLSTGVATPAGRTVAARLATDVETPDDAAAPSVVSPAVLAAAGRGLGDEFEIVVSGARIPLRLIGTVDVLPGAIDEPLPVLVDIDAVAAARWRQQRAPTRAEAWLLDIDGLAAGGAGRASLDASRTLAATLGGGEIRAPQVSTTVIDAAQRSADPIAVGLLVALAMGAVAAVLLALVGTVTAATVSVRERAAEFALLQAVGTSMRQIRSWLASEVAVVVVTGLVAGGLLGTLLVWAVLPTIGLATDGSLAVPAPRVVVPLRTLGVATALVVGVFALVPIGLARSVARAHVAEVLRLGGDT